MKKRPFIFTHMLTSLDGKIIGRYMRLPEESDNAADFRDLAFRGYELPFDSWLCGRATAEADYTYGKAPVITEEDLAYDGADGPALPEGDFLAAPVTYEDSEGKIRKTRFLFILDRRGKLGWQSGIVPYGEPESHVVSVLTEEVPDSYKAFLRRTGVSYVVCGKDDIDYDVLFDKMVDVFGVARLMVTGGGLVSWLMVKRGYAEEVSYFTVPAADGSSETQTMFMAAEGATDDIPVAFELLEVRAFPAGGVWHHYRVKKVWDKDEYREVFGDEGKDFVAEANK